MSKHILGSTPVPVVVSADSELFTNCSQVSITRIVCDEKVTGYKVGRSGSAVELPAGSYELSCPDSCAEECWACIEPKYTPVIITPDPVICAPLITEIFGDSDEPATFTEIAVSNPLCCKVLIKTNAGLFTVMPGEDFVSQTVDCNILLESIEVEGDCDPSSVHTILTKRY